MIIAACGVNQPPEAEVPGSTCYDRLLGETSQMPQTSDQSSPTSERLTLAQAARLTGMPKAYLRELIESGRLAVHLIPENGDTKQRVSQIGLIEAGVLSAEPVDAAPPHSELSELIALVRDQSTRITTLEEQRFLLGAQLGAALERVATLEEQMLALPHVSNGHSDPIGASEIEQELAEARMNSDETRASSSVRNVVVRAGELGIQRSTELGVKVVLRGARLFGRTRRSADR